MYSAVLSQNESKERECPVFVSSASEKKTTKKRTKKKKVKEKKSWLGG